MLDSRFMCLFNSHRPNREGVEWNGFHYVATCRHCGAPIRRLDKGGWRRRQTERA